MIDVLATYGLMVVGAVICGAISIVACFVWFWAEADGDRSYTAPRPWESVYAVIPLVVPFVALVGAAVLIGPSSDLGNFVRAVGGVLVGLATCLAIVYAALPRVPVRLTKRLGDGRVLTGDEAERYYATHPGPSRWEAGWAFALFVCLVPPVAGVVVAVLIAEWG